MKHFRNQQAQAMAKSLSHVKFTAIHASPLKRAFSTAEALHSSQQEPKPPLLVSPLLREQHFGAAEGQPWSMTLHPDLSLEEHFERQIWPVLPGRAAKFPEGESLNDLQARAEKAIEEIIMPYVWDTAKSGWKDVHIAVVSHGLCISELIAALIRKEASDHAEEGRRWTGLLNTAWSRVEIDLPVSSFLDTFTVHVFTNFCKILSKGQVFTAIDSDTPPLVITVSNTNVHKHLEQVVRRFIYFLIPFAETFVSILACLQKRQRGGIGSAAYDPKQQDIRAFFGGGGTAANETEEGRSVSNVYDEIDQKL